MNHGAARREVCGYQSNPARHARPGWACRATHMKHGAARRVVRGNQSNPARHARPGWACQAAKYDNGAARRVVWEGNQPVQSDPARSACTCLHGPASQHMGDMARFGMWRIVVEARRK